jgi:hypothetical protein
MELYFHSPITPSWRDAQLKKSTGTILPTHLPLRKINLKEFKGTLRIIFLANDTYLSEFMHLTSFLSTSNIITFFQTIMHLSYQVCFLFCIQRHVKYQVEVFWVVTPCSVVVGYQQRLVGPCCLELHPEDGGSMVL